jgi:ribosomal protein L37E
MGHNDLRHDTECQNCGHTVAQIYCPHCGQKNTETRQSFWHLITHFAEDLTHYDGAFWKTIKYLLFRPAFLTKEYLMGKRMAYVPPVKLYIFISFIAFFLPAIMPDMSKEAESDTEENIDAVTHPVLLNKQENVWITSLNYTNGQLVIANPMSYKSVKEMDSIENIKPDGVKMGAFQHWMGKRLIHLYSSNTPKQVGEKFSEGFVHNMPKVIFLYMPFFAFWLWLFHSKKRWYFFDHSIFTLHFFSFLLLNFAFVSIILSFAADPPNDVIGILFLVLILLSLLWQLYYYYRSHRKMYHESWLINVLKCTAMLLINLTGILFILLLSIYITLYTLH